MREVILETPKACQFINKFFFLMTFRERYRDLILAADTIGKMKITSEGVTSKIANIESKFKELQKKYLIGFKTELIEDKLDRFPFSDIATFVHVMC